MKNHIDVSSVLSVTDFADKKCPKINNIPVSMVKELKHFGVNLDCTLTWNPTHNQHRQLDNKGIFCLCINISMVRHGDLIQKLLCGSILVLSDP